LVRIFFAGRPHRSIGETFASHLAPSAFAFDFPARSRHGYDVLINDDVPKSWDDIAKYSNPSGLNQVMR